MRRNEINVITLGCSKNLVDTGALMRRFAARGYRLRHNPARITGEIVVVNTCGFIESAQQESIDTILSLARAKEKGLIRQLYVMGCLTERFGKELAQEIPGIDAVYGKFDWSRLADRLPKISEQPLASPGITPKHYAYLKISEGCNRTCSYCAIPLITGKHRSVPQEELLKRAQELIRGGASELILIAQDTTAYGTDLYGRSTLPSLLRALAELPGLRRLRLHYAYPTAFPLDLLPVMAHYPTITPYLDLALQHSSNRMLSLMRRGITREETLQLIRTIRRSVPGIVLRTTMMVGHPGETEEDFQDLLQFIAQARFERLGAFAYSHEQGTYAYKHYPDDVPPRVKEERLSRLMEAQLPIAQDFNQSLVGKVQEIVIDRSEPDYFVGRTVYDSPEVDPEVLVPKRPGLRLLRGHYYPARIIGAEDYDLIAQVD